MQRFVRGLAVGCLLLLALLPVSVGVMHHYWPRAEGLRQALFWTWLFVSPMLAGTGLLLSMLALVVVNPRHRAAATLMGFLATAFLLLMSQMI